MTKSCAEVAALIHADMCNDDDNGYSWSPRHGEDGKPVKTLAIDGEKFQYDRGSWDCSSSTIKAWSEAIKHTRYAGRLDAASTTYDMREVFVASGLFEWKPMSYIAARGDLYLDEDTHVAMCQSQEPDLMSEFCINENGEVYGGEPGDQTGWEAAINPFREEFDGILHYNGKADSVAKKTPKDYGLTDGSYVTTVNKVGIRSQRKVASDLCCTLAKGAALKLKNFKMNSVGNIWAEVASGDHKGRFVLVRKANGTQRVKKK